MIFRYAMSTIKWDLSLSFLNAILYVINTINKNEPQIGTIGTLAKLNNTKKPTKSEFKGMSNHI